MSDTSDTTSNTTDVSTSTPSSSVDQGTPAPSGAPPADTAGSPPASTDKAPSPSDGSSREADRQGLLAAVKAVLPDTPDPKAATSDTDAGATVDQPATGGEAAAGDGREPPPPETDTTDTDDLNAPDPTEAELKKLRPETRKRFERLLGQRNQARSELQAVRPELDAHRQLQGYLSEHQLAPDDVNALLSIGAHLRKGDYQSFLNGVTPYVMAAQEALGMRVARDLQTQVDEGTLSEEAARQMTATRHRAAQAEHRLKEQGQQHQVERQNATVTNIRQAVDQWEANIRSRDPDYAHKATAVRRYSQALLHERGTPRSPEEAVALTQAAYDEATRELVRIRGPAPQATKATPTSGSHGANGASRTQTPSEPKTLKDAILKSLSDMRRAS
jgi:hypothetical protein